MERSPAQHRPYDREETSGDAGEERALRSPRRSGYRISGLQGRVITELGRAIVSGRFAPGELLPRETELMAEFSASRPSLREALKVLAAKGLIEMRQKVGTRVRSHDLWTMFDSDVLAWHLGDESSDGVPQGRPEAILHDFIEMRQVIEPAAARLAAGRARLDDLGRIREALRAMEAADSELPAYASADAAFHMAVFSASHNVLLAGFSHLVGDFLHRIFRIQQSGLNGANEWDSFVDGDLEQHRLVFEAINRGDGEAAAEAMLRDIINGKNVLLSAMS